MEVNIMAEKYVRKISNDEAHEQYILILKNALNFFPKIGHEFKLKIGDKEFDIKIDAIPCWCQGPQKPHDHYRIDTKNFKNVFAIHFGKKITFVKNSETEYSLS
jgi:hypothetical protein